MCVAVVRVSYVEQATLVASHKVSKPLAVSLNPVVGLVDNCNGLGRIMDLATCCVVVILVQNLMTKCHNRIRRCDYNILPC